MSAPRVPAPVRFVAILGVIVLGLSGCGLHRPHPAGTLQLPAPRRTSVLVIITDLDSPPALRATGALAAASARPGETIIVLSLASGATLITSQAPVAPSMQVPVPPAPLPQHPTTFQQHRHAQAVRQYQSMLQRDQAALRRHQQEELASWARSVVARADSGPVVRRTQNADIDADLGAAASDLFSLRQAGLGSGTGTVIAILGVGSAAARTAPTPPADLQGSTVAVADFPGSIGEQAAWQASLLQAGAARAVLLTQGTEGQLTPVVQQGLSGAITDTLTSVLFGLGQYTLRAAALPQLRHLLRLLTVSYPGATATINGYTDNLPVPGGNLRLSRLRARRIEQWLVAHGVPADRIQAFGYGDTDPVAPDTANGQPFDRRVVVVIDPAAPAQAAPQNGEAGGG
jgi:outer membrane protein OmpA-like peptidoglycan-associated protein